MKHGWEYKKLGETLVFDKRFNGLSKGEQTEVVNFSHVSAEELKNLVENNGDVKLISTGSFSGYTTIERAGNNLNKGEIVTIPTGGALNIKYHKGLFVDSGNIIGIAKDNTIYLRYIYYSMLANNETISSFFRGASIKHPYMPDIYKILIPVPTLKEQQQIVSELDKLNLVIEKKQQQVKELDNLAQAIFYDMFGDPVENEKGWERRCFKEICEVTSSKRVYQSEWHTSGVPFYRISDFTRFLEGTNIVPELFITRNKYEELKLNDQVPEAGDILITSRGTLGNCYIVKDDDRFYFQDGMITWLRRMSKQITPLFIVFLFKNSSFRCQIDKNQSGSTVAYLSISMLKNFILPTPPLSLQQSFAKKIESIERQKELINQSVREAQTLFDSRMEYYFGE